MRLRLILSAFCLFSAPAAYAETWQVLYWDTQVLLAVDSGGGRVTGDNRRTVQHTRLENSGRTVTATVSDQEVDCYDQTVRERTSRQRHGDMVTAQRREVGPWRSAAAEPDRVLIGVICATDSFKPVIVRDATLDEAMKAHKAVGQNPDLLAVQPSLAKWVTVFNNFQPAGPVQAQIPSIYIPMIAEHEFIPLQIDRSGATFAADEIEPAGQHWVRWHEVEVASYRDPKHGGVWRLKEFDCKAFAGRDLAVGVFDRSGHILHGYEQRMWNVPFAAVAPESGRGALLAAACDPVKRGDYSTVRSDLRGVVTGYQTFHQPALATVFGGGPATPWRDVYAYYCGPFGCRTHASVELAKRLAIAGLLAAATLVGGLYLRARHRRLEQEARA